MKRLVVALFFVASGTLAQPVSIVVDTTDAHRGIFHSHLTIPAAPGPMTLVYPKWVPGEHTPTGPLMQMAGLHMRAGQTELTWRRDLVDMFAFHVDVPAGAHAIDVDFDYMSPSSTFADGYGESANATQRLLLVLFGHHLLYPANPAPRSGHNYTDTLVYQASVRLPDGWKFDTALPVKSQDGNLVQFDAVPLTTLVDSPLTAGAYTRTIPIADDGREHLTLTADSAGALALSDERVAQLRNLVGETDELFGARHYRRYIWLVTLSDLIETQGLEHHESTDIRGRESAMTDPDWTVRMMGTLSHEFVHSWNGKYRRPAGLSTPDWQEPMIGELLFVYEGMTRYYGDLVLTARSGIRTPEQDRDYAAYVAANQDRNRPGRMWRPLVDTTIGVSAISPAPSEEVPYRRGLDYYDESMLIWLDADMIIRAKSGGTKSLDDFARLFFGPPATAPMLKPFTLSDVVTALNAVAPYDWSRFIDERVYRIAPHPPLGALEAAGWRLVYNETPNWYVALRDRSGASLDATFSLGMSITKDGTISDVVYGSPAYGAGLMPGMKIDSVNGRTFDLDTMREEIRASKQAASPIEVHAQQASFAGTFRIDYHGGTVYPHLERIEGKPDLLSDVMRARAGTHSN